MCWKLEESVWSMNKNVCSVGKPYVKKETQRLTKGGVTNPKQYKEKRLHVRARY